MQDMSRIRRPVNITLDPEVIAALDAWIEQQPIRAGRSAVIETAIQEFLDTRAKQKGKRNAGSAS